MNEIMQAISTLGFPIVVAVAMFVEIHRQNTEWRTLLAQQTDTWRTMIGTQNAQHTAEVAEQAAVIREMTAELRASNEQVRIMLVKTGILDE